MKVKINQLARSTRVKMKAGSIISQTVLKPRMKRESSLNECTHSKREPFPENCFLFPFPDRVNEHLETAAS